VEERIDRERVLPFSAEESDRLRGPQHQVAWFDELAAYPNKREIWDMAQFGLRLGKRPPTSPVDIARVA